MQPTAPGRASTTPLPAAISARFLTVMPLLTSPARVSILSLGTTQRTRPSKVGEDIKGILLAHHESLEDWIGYALQEEYELPRVVNPGGSRLLALPQAGFRKKWITTLRFGQDRSGIQDCGGSHSRLPEEVVGQTLVETKLGDFRGRDKGGNALGQKTAHYAWLVIAARDRSGEPPGECGVYGKYPSSRST